MRKTKIIATQILGSMVVSPTPIQAERSDIANTVLDGCDAIPLSDETAVGKYPVDTIRVADTTIREAERAYPYHQVLRSRGRTQAVAATAGQLVRDIHAKPIVVTSTGRAAFQVSWFRLESDILVFSHEAVTLRRASLGWGLFHMGLIPPERDVADLVASLVKASLESGLVDETDVVTIVHGFPPGVSGTTNTIQVLDIREYLEHTSTLESLEVRT
jgi:pyruvate kinase